MSHQDFSISKNKDPATSPDKLFQGFTTLTVQKRFSYAHRRAQEALATFSTRALYRLVFSFASTRIPSSSPAKLLSRRSASNVLGGLVIPPQWQDFAFLLHQVPPWPLLQPALVNGSTALWPTNQIFHQFWKICIRTPFWVLPIHFKKTIRRRNELT